MAPPRRAADRERGSSASAALRRVLDRRGKRAAYRPLPPRRLRRAVQRLEPCLPLLSRRERRVLRVRAGLDGSRPLSVRRTARRLGLSRRRVVAIEGRSLAKLRLAWAAGSCGGGTGPLAPATAGATALPERGLGTGSGGPLDREPFGSLSIDRVGSGLDSRELLVLLAGLAVFIAAIARVRRRI